MKFFSYISNMTHMAHKYGSNTLPFVVAGALRSRKHIGNKKAAMLGVGAQLASTGAGAIHGAIREAIGKHKLKKAGYNMDKDGFIEIEDSDGNKHKVHMNSMHTHAGTSHIRTKALKNPIARHFYRTRGLDVPMGYKDDLIVNVDPWAVKYDQRKTKAVTMHEIGHKMDERLKTKEGERAYREDSRPFEEYADRYAVKNGATREELRDAVHEYMEALDPALKWSMSKKDREKLYEKADKKYRGTFLYRKSRKKKKQSEEKKDDAKD